MIVRSTVTFQELRQLLEELGFTPSRQGKSWLFEHVPSKTTLVYRQYRSRERIMLKDLLVTRQDLDWHGLMAPEAFDDRLRKATA